MGSDMCIRVSYWSEDNADQKLEKKDDRAKEQGQTEKTPLIIEDFEIKEFEDMERISGPEQERIVKILYPLITLFSINKRIKQASKAVIEYKRCFKLTSRNLCA